MNEIKVSVTYEKPATTKFDALMAEYEAAKKMADETVSYYKPLADAAEDAKFDAIMEQLETVKDYANQISEIKGESVWLRAKNPKQAIYFVVIYRKTSGYEIEWSGIPFSKQTMHNHPNRFCEGAWNIIGMWDEWKIYEQLEKDAFCQLKQAIDQQYKKAEHQVSRLYNIIEEE